MSVRLILNLLLAMVAALLLSSVGMIVRSLEPQDDDPQLGLIDRQKILVQNMTMQTTDLVQADSAAALSRQRDKLARTILSFDQTLTALQFGGVVVQDGGARFEVAAIGDDGARLALEECSDIWYDLGMPLADLAAAEFSPYSAAGRQAIAGLQDGNANLVRQLTVAEEALRRGEATRLAVARYASLAAAVLAVVLMVLVVLRARSGRTEAPTPGTRAADYLASLGNTELEPRVAVAPSSAPPPLNLESDEVTDLDVAGAVVDRMAVDMSTVATSTAKMRAAIDSVGAAMQDMLVKLDGMAQDTAAGYDLVQNAGNAAAYTADAVEELTGAAGEMGRVVERVTLLAEKTRRTARQVNADCEEVARPGDRFGAVVAGEVQSLVARTAAATLQIEDTVARILGNSRQYEEAIGQIVQNVSAINAACNGLGDKVLPLEDDEPAVETADLDEAGVDLENPPTADPLDETGDEKDPLDEATAQLEAVDVVAELAQDKGGKSDAAPAAADAESAATEPVPADTEPEPEQDLERVVADTSALIDEVADLALTAGGDKTAAAKDEAPPAEAAPLAPGDEADDILSDESNDTRSEPENAARPEPESDNAEEADEEPAAEAAQDAPAADIDGDPSQIEGDILILNKASGEVQTSNAQPTETADQEAGAEAETAARPKIPEPVGSNRNVFILNPRPQAAADGAAAPAAATQNQDLPDLDPEESANPEAGEPDDSAVTSPADDDDGTIFMLNKPRKS